MTKAQLEKLLGITLTDGKDTYTDDEVFDLINRSQTDLKDELNKNKNLVSQRNSEIAEYKRQKQEKMTDEEKTKQQITELETKVASYEKTIARGQKVSEYMGIGYSKELAEKIADAELEGKPTAKLHKEFISAREEELRAEFLKNPPKPKTTDSSATVTRETYKQMTYSEKMALKEKDPELFAQVSKEPENNN